MMVNACKASLALFAIFFIASTVGDVYRLSSAFCRCVIALYFFSSRRTVSGVLTIEPVEDEQGSEGGGGDGRLIIPNLPRILSGLNGKTPVDLKALSMFLLLNT